MQEDIILPYHILFLIKTDPLCLKLNVKPFTVSMHTIIPLINLAISCKTAVYREASLRVTNFRKIKNVVGDHSKLYRKLLPLTLTIKKRKVLKLSQFFY